MKRNIIIGAAVIIVLLVGYFAVKGGKSKDASEILISVESGMFQVDVETTAQKNRRPWGRRFSLLYRFLLTRYGFNNGAIVAEHACIAFASDFDKLPCFLRSFVT